MPNPILKKVTLKTLDISLTIQNNLSQWKSDNTSTLNSAMRLTNNKAETVFIVHYTKCLYALGLSLRANIVYLVNSNL